MWRNIKRGVGFLIVVAALVLVPQRVSAADFRYEASMDYEVKKNGKTVVTEKYRVTNLTNTKTLADFTVHAPSTAINAINARFGDGKKIATTTQNMTGSSGDVSYQFTAINLDFKRQIKGNNKTFNFTVSYVADGLLHQSGQFRTLFIPGIGSGAQNLQYNVELETPLEYGTPKLGTGNVKRQSIINGTQFMSWSGDKLAHDSIALVFGDHQVYRVNLKAPLKNTWPWWRTAEVALPPELASQQTYVNSVTPRPDNTRLDQYGNTLATFQLDPLQGKDVETDVLVNAPSVLYDLEKSQGFADIPEQMRQQYTAATALWPHIDAVTKPAGNLTEPDKPVAASVRAMYNYVVDNLSYNDRTLALTDQRGAGAALADAANASAFDYADVLTSMLRSQDIPAREVVGYAYSAGLKPSAEPADSLHVWVEAYVPGVGWMTLDPVWGEKFDHFGHHTSDHVALAVWGDSNNPVSPVQIGGDATDYQYETAQITSVKEQLPQQDLQDVSLSVTRHVLLPFVSVERLIVTMPKGYSADNLAARVGEKTLLIGSLAPNEKKVLRRPLLGGQWNQTPAAVLAQQANGELTEELAAAEVQTSYLPLYVIIALLIAAILVWLWWRRRRRRKTFYAEGSTHQEPVEQEDLAAEHVQLEPVVHHPETPHQPEPAEPEPAAAPAAEDNVPAADPGQIIAEHPEPEMHTPGQIHHPNSREVPVEDTEFKDYDA